MRNIILLLCFLSSMAFAQERYFVFFADKGSKTDEALNKNSAEYAQAISILSKRAIERRKKSLGDNFISFEDLPINPDYVKSLESLGIKIRWELRWFNAASCEIPNDLIPVVKRMPFVTDVKKVSTISYKNDSPGYMQNEQLQKSDSHFAFDYGASLPQNELSEIPAVHEKNINGEGVVIALLDAGFYLGTNPSLSHIEVIDAFDFVYNDTDVGNDNDVSHGTSVLSIAAGFEEGALIGPAYNSKFILAKTEDIRSETHIEEDNFAAAVQWVESRGVDIISSSLGYNTFDTGGSYVYAQLNGKTTIVTRAMNMAFDLGVITVTSAGNEGNDPWIYITAPADAYNIIAVGAVTPSKKIAGFSSRGPTSDGRIKPDVVAVGAPCYGADAHSNGYSYSNGTSNSAPLVAGMAAQLLSHYPHLNNRQVRNIVLESGDRTNVPDNNWGYGLLSAKRMIEYPNIEMKDGKIIVHKSFITNTPPSEVYLKVYKSEEDVIPVVHMIEETEYSFFRELGYLNSGDSLNISFEYKDADGNLVRVPFSGYYKYVYGDEIIKRFTDGNIGEVPKSFKLYHNYPNPFNPGTTIEYSISKPSRVKIDVFNILGEHVISLMDEFKSAGNYADIYWNGVDKHGRKVSSGVYIYTLNAGDFLTSKKMVYLK